MITKKEERSESKINRTALAAGIFLGVRVLIFAVLLIWNELAGHKASYIDGEGLVRVALLLLAIPGLSSGIVLLLSVSLKTPSVQEAGTGSETKTYSVLRRFAIVAAIGAVILYWLYLIFIPFLGIDSVFFACSIGASVISLVPVIASCLMKNYIKMKGKRRNEAVDSGPEEKEGEA